MTAEPPTTPPKPPNDDLGSQTAQESEIEPESEEDILRSKLRTQGRIITTVCETNARLERRIHTLVHAANGQPTPRIVTQIKKIRAAAGTNSITKILDLIELGIATQNEGGRPPGNDAA